MPEIIRHHNNYQINTGTIQLYNESIQHILAITRLMRINKKSWFDFINKILEINKLKNPLELNIHTRLKLFSKAFLITIKKNYAKYPQVKIKTPIHCPNCHSSKFKKTIFVNHHPSTFCIKVCSNCHLGTQFPVLDQVKIDKIYQNQNYFSGNSTKTGYYNYAKEAIWRIKKAKKYLNQVLSATKLIPQNTRALDVGCGYGYFLKALQDKGIRAEGIEVSPSACEYAKSNYNSTVFSYDLNEAFKKGLLKANSYNLITLWDVLEHFSDFNSQITIISKLLKPDGYIALRTNNIDSIETKTLGSYFHSIKNEHLFYFSPKSLDSIFVKHHYKKISIWTHTHIFLAFMTIKERNQCNKNNLGGDIFYICQKK
jgi:2-polyprenyl-3-methyl-5-hydroxy-6-metoxy-1,4-benzoquinol methylase